ncbi:MAG: hypothetical protein J6P21_00325 [Clostridia bacterium]|nr:hypothetical protein [Clostridia bacterium]
MFRNSRKVLGSLACAAVLAGANPNAKVEAGAGAKVGSAVLGTVSTGFGVVNLLQAFGVGTGEKDDGPLGMGGSVGKWLGRPYGEVKDNKPGKLQPLVMGIGKIVLGAGGIVFAIVG